MSFRIEKIYIKRASFEFKKFLLENNVKIT